MERSFFHQVFDVFEGIVVEPDEPLRSFAHRRGVKVWFGDAVKEHYEAQLIRIDGEAMLEIGFHVEYPKPAANDEVLSRLTAVERTWRKVLGAEPEAGGFIGSTNWRRISEVWDPPDPDDVDAAIEVGARLAEYAMAIEPLRAAEPAGHSPA